jgi:hypothetical protein
VSIRSPREISEFGNIGVPDQVRMNNLLKVPT